MSYHELYPSTRLDCCSEITKYFITRVGESNHSLPLPTDFFRSLDFVLQGPTIRHDDSHGSRILSGSIYYRFCNNDFHSLVEKMMALCGGDCMISILRRTIRNTGAVLNSSVLCRRVSQSISMDHSLALFSVIQSLMFLLSLRYACSSELSAIS